MDYYLKSDSEAAMQEAFGAVTVDTERGHIVTYPVVEGMALDVVGIIYKPTGETHDVALPGGVNISEPVYAPSDGWCVNLRGEGLPEILEQYRITPANPRRVWA